MHENILFLTIDGLRSDRFYGRTKSAKTPFLDTLRKQGTYFKQDISCADGTTLALNSTFSGLFPFRTGTRAKEVQMNQSSFIHLLRNHGYHIYGIVPNLTSLSRLRFNFENNINSFKGIPPEIERLNDGTGKKIINLFEQNKMKEPWLCYLHPLDLHDPLIVPKNFDDVRFGNSRYEKILSSIDVWVEKIFEKINTTNTLIIITADHGSIIPEGDLEFSDFEPQFKTGLKVGKKIMPHSTHKFGAKVIIGIRDKIRDSRLKKANEGLTPYQVRSRLPYFRLTLFDEAIRVPLLFLGKNIPKNKVVSDQVSNVDIFPTILELIGISDKLQRDGRSLTSYFNDKVVSEREVYLHTIPYDEKSLQDKVGVRTSKYKYFRHARNRTVNVNLYDIENDPYENNNIANDNSDIVKKMENILEELTENSTIETMDNLGDEKLKKIQNELKLLGYKKTWKEKSN